MRKSLQLLFLFMVMVVSLSLPAGAVVIDNIDYTLNTTSKTAAALTYTGSATSLIVPQTIESDGETYTVTTIASSTGSAGFAKNNTTLQSVTLPTSITAIYESAFDGCTNLSQVNLSELTKLTYLRSYAFRGTALTSVVFPSGLSSTSSYVFQDCVSLVSADFSKSKIKSVSSLFKGCTSLTTVTLLSTTTSLGGTFEGCTKLASITIPTTVTSIGQSTFKGCTSLTTMDFSKHTKITSIGNYAFQNCTALTKIVLPPALTTIGSYAFQSSAIGTHLTIPETVKTIGQMAFYQCTKLVVVDMSKTSVSVISAHMFDGCTGLLQLALPPTVTELGEGCFARMKALEVVVSDTPASYRLNIPTGVEKVGFKIFDGNIGIVSMDLRGLKVDPKLPYSAFENCTGLNFFAFPECANLSSWSLKTSLTGFFYNLNTDITVILPSGEYSTAIPGSFFYKTRLKKVIFPEGKAPERIGVYAFAESPLRGIEQEDGLMTFRIPEGVKTIEHYAFNMGAKGLVTDTLIIPGSVTSIGNGGFQNVKSSVLIFEAPTVDEEAPASAASRVETPSLTMGANAFSAISTSFGPAQIYTFHPVPPTIQASSFSDLQYKNTKLIVDPAYEDAYRNATGWKNFADNFVVTGVDKNEVQVAIETDTQIYNLQGIPVSSEAKLPSGIYIRGGKKIYIH